VIFPASIVFSLPTARLRILFYWLYFRKQCQKHRDILAHAYCSTSLIGHLKVSKMNTTLASIFLTTVLLSATAAAQTIRVFSGGQSQRPDLMRKMFDVFEKSNPGVKVEIETGGQTAELQREYLDKVLNAKEAALDVFMIDITNPRLYQSKGWIEPLNQYLGRPASALADHLPVYRTTNVINGQIYAMPAFADAMFIYFRKDLLQKYNVREPRTWEQLAAVAKKIKTGERTNPNLQGLSIQGAPIEGTVCTFLLPIWSKGGDVADSDGKFKLDALTAQAGIELWLKLIDEGVIAKNASETKTIDTVNDFKAGNVIFAINWGFAWDRFQNDADSKVKRLVDVMPMVRVGESSKSATCVGGWQWAVSAYSKNKPLAAKLVGFMSTPDVAKFLAVEGSLLPVFSSTFTDAAYLAKVPWASGAGVIATFGRSRPVSARYGEVSDAIRASTSAMLARRVSPQQGVADLSAKLKPMLP
jgi:multiple sugar transport system substrate-binding protein